MVLTTLIKKAVEILSGKSLRNEDGSFLEMEFRIGEVENNKFKSNMNFDHWHKLFNRYVVGKKAAHTLSVDFQFIDPIRDDILKSMNIKPTKINRTYKKGRKVQQQTSTRSDVKTLRTLTSLKNNKTITDKMTSFWKWLDTSPIEKVQEKVKYLTESTPMHMTQTYSIKKNIENHTIDSVRLSHNMENDMPEATVAKYKNVMDNYYNIKTFRFKNRFSRSIDGWLRMDFTIAKMLRLRRATREAHIGGRHVKRGDYILEHAGDFEYSVEVEFTDWNSRLMSPEVEKSRIDVLKKVLYQLQSVNYSPDFIFKLNPWNAVPLKKSDLYKIKLSNYTLTDKADGVRCHMVVYGKKIHFINPHTKKHIFKPIDNVNDLPVCVFDGEYIQYLDRFLIFDVLIDTDRKNPRFWNDLRSLNLYNRLRRALLYKDKFEGLKMIKETKGFEGTPIEKTVPLQIDIKRFYNINAANGSPDDIFKIASLLWEKREKLFDYQLDGLIFTPLYAPYGERNDTYALYKWKPHLTIDVRVEWDRKFNYTAFHCNSNRGTQWNGVDVNHFRNKMPVQDYNELNDAGLLSRQDIIYNRMIIRNDDKLIDQIIASGHNFGKEFTDTDNRGRERRCYIIGHHGKPTSHSSLSRIIIAKYDIVEYMYNTNLKQWLPLRFRTSDKPNPNSYWTVKDTIASFLYNPTLDDFKRYSGDLPRQSILNLYNNQNLLDKNKKRNVWRKYNNFVKNRMYGICRELANPDKSKFHYHLDLGCGRLGDLDKWLRHGYTHILAIDKAKENIKEGEKRLRSRGYRLTKDRSAWYRVKENQTHYIWLVLGDCSYGIEYMNKMFDPVTLGAVDNPDTQEMIRRAKFSTQRFVQFYLDDQKWPGFNTIASNFSIHYFFGDAPTSGNGPWLPNSDKTFHWFRDNVSNILADDGIFFGTFIDGKELHGDHQTYTSQKGDLMYSYDKIFENGLEAGKQSQTDVIPTKWSSNFKYIDTLQVYNEVWGAKGTEPIIKKQYIDSLTKDFGMTQAGVGEDKNPVNSTFEYYYKAYLEYAKSRATEMTKHIVKNELETPKEFRERLDDAKDRMIIDNFALSDSEKKLSYINSTFAYKFGEEIKSLNPSYGKKMSFPGIISQKDKPMRGGLGYVYDRDENKPMREGLGFIGSKKDTFKPIQFRAAGYLEDEDKPVEDKPVRGVTGFRAAGYLEDEDKPVEDKPVRGVTGFRSAGYLEDKPVRGGFRSAGNEKDTYKPVEFKSSGYLGEVKNQQSDPVIGNIPKKSNRRSF